MLKYLFLFLVLVSVACNNDVGNSSEEGNTTTATDAETVNPLHQALQRNTFNQFLAATDASFSVDKFHPSGQYSLSTVQSNYAPTSISGYKGLLAYNSDSTKAVDLFSYGTFIQDKRLQGGEPDSEAALLDLTTNTRKRLLYLGPSYAFTSASIRGNEVTISGYERLAEDKIKPLFWMINMNQNQVQLYEYDGSIKGNTSEFFRQQYPDYTFN